MREDWGGRASAIVAFIALATTTKTSLLMLTASSRLTYGIARDGYFPPLFAVLSGSGAPMAASFAVFLVAGLFAALADIELVASVTDFIVFVTFLVVNAAVISLRFQRPGAARTMRVPLTLGKVPGVAVVAFAMTAVMMASLKAEAWGLGGLALALGAMAWLLMAKRKGDAAQAEAPSAGSSSG
jgi:APA family basic amino acid/polyamine antiporter